MATAPAQLAAIRQWMTDTIVSKVTDQLNREIVALDMFQRLNVNWTDGQAIVPIIAGRNDSAAYKAEATNAVPGNLPVAKSIDRQRLTVDAKFLYARMSLTGQAIESGRNNPAGLKSTLREELDGCIETIKNRANKLMFCGGGVIGFLHEHKNAAGAANWEFCGNLDMAPPVGAPQAATFFRMDTYAQVGVAINVEQIAGNDTELALAAAFNTVALPSGVPVSVVMAAGVAPGDNAAETFGDQPKGIYSNLALKDHFGAANDRSTAAFSELRSTIITQATGVAGAHVFAAPTTKRLQGFLTQISRKSDQRPDCFFVEHGFLEEYVGLLTSTLQTQTREKAGAGDAGFNPQALAFAGVPFKASRHCGKGLVVGLNRKSWSHCTLAGPGLADQDGNVLDRVGGSDSYEAYARWYHQLVSKRPNANGILTGITYS